MTEPQLPKAIVDQLAKIRVEATKLPDVRATRFRSLSANDLVDIVAVLREKKGMTWEQAAGFLHKHGVSYSPPALCTAYKRHARISTTTKGN